MKKKNKIYCIYCGKNNDADADKCKACGKKLNEKEHELLDFVIDETKEQIKGNLFDKIIAFFKSLITKYLYGTVLTVSVVTFITSSVINVIANNNENSDIDVTNDKYAFNELSDAEKLTGCWIGHSNIDDTATYYVKFYDKERFARVTIYSDGNPYYTSGYYLAFDEEMMGISYTNLYFGPKKEVEAQYFQMQWEGDNVFRYGELNYAETRYERIKCEDFPKYEENAE